MFGRSGDIGTWKKKRIQSDLLAGRFRFGLLNRITLADGNDSGASLRRPIADVGAAKRQS